MEPIDRMRKAKQKAGQPKPPKIHQATPVEPAKVKQPQQPKRKKFVGGRLPDLSAFALWYDANAILWTGTLTVEGVEFKATAKSVYGLLSKLDTLHRKHANIRVIPQE
jgi:hypothetical protein